MIVHASDKLGLVLVDRSTLPVGGGNITLSFGAYPDELPGRVRFLHPLHNFAIISYDPTRLSHQVRQEVTALLTLQTPFALCVCVCVCVRMHFYPAGTQLDVGSSVDEQRHIRDAIVHRWHYVFSDH